MKFDTEYLHDRRLVHRTGLAIDRHTLRREHEAAHIVSFAIALAFITIFIAGCLGLGGVR